MSELVSIIPQTDAAASPARDVLGTRGEILAAEYLEREGCTVVMTNFTAPVGRNSRGAAVTGEIDIIALDGETICFVEVKTRRSEEIAGPLANVNLRKQRQIARTARVYRQIFGLQEMQYRFDVVSVLMEKGLAPKLELIRGFWSEAKFKKRSWNDVPY